MPRPFKGVDDTRGLPRAGQDEIKVLTASTDCLSGATDVGKPTWTTTLALGNCRCHIFFAQQVRRE